MTIQETSVIVFLVGLFVFIGAGLFMALLIRLMRFELGGARR